MISSYYDCACGAITLDIGGVEYSGQKKSFKKIFPNLDLRRIPRVPRNTVCACNHCVNHWGIDLCGCGSGEEFGKCDANTPYCSKPMQEIGVRTNINAGFFSIRGGESA